MITQQDINRLRALRNEAAQAVLHEDKQQIVDNNREFLERMAAEYKAKWGAFPAEVAAIARQFGIEQ